MPEDHERDARNRAPHDLVTGRVGSDEVPDGRYSEGEVGVVRQDRLVGRSAGRSQHPGVRRRRAGPASEPRAPRGARLPGRSGAAAGAGGPRSAAPHTARDDGGSRVLFGWGQQVGLGGSPTSGRLPQCQLGTGGAEVPGLQSPDFDRLLQPPELRRVAQQAEFGRLGAVSEPRVHTTGVRRQGSLSLDG